LSRGDKFKGALQRGDVSEMRAVLKDAGVPVDQIESVIKTGQKINAGINEETLNDGSWLTNTFSALGAPEVKVWQISRSN
jgi:hypothetical protein